MTKSRMWTTGTALVVVAVLLAGWFLLVSPKRSEATELKDTATAAESANESTEATVRQLKLDQKQLPAQRAEIAGIKKQIPPQPLEPSMIRQVANIATASDVDLGSIAPNALAALPTTTGVQYIATTITVGGDYSKFKAFLDGLEENQRAFLVEGFSITENDGEDIDGDLLLTVKARIFVAIEPVAGAATGATAGAATTPGTTPGTTPTAAASPAAPVG